MQAINRQPPVHYERHCPEQTTLYRLMQQHAATFFEQAQAAAGADLPEFITGEFDAFLECGILAHGFLRLRCGDCGHDKLVAFSCKRRGFCPSCGARRMAQTAAHLVDHVIPRVPVRHWVLSLPIPLRLLLAAQPKLVTPVLQVVHRAITLSLVDRAGLKAEQAEQADSGAVTLIQRSGSAANLNLSPSLPGARRRVPVRHRARICLRGSIRANRRGAAGGIALLTRKGVLVEEQGQTTMADDDTDSDEARVLRPLQAAAWPCRPRRAGSPTPRQAQTVHWIV